MKVVLVLLLLIVGVVAYLLLGSSGSSPTPDPAAPVAVQPGQAAPPVGPAVAGEPVADATQSGTATSSPEVAPRAVSANSFVQDAGAVGGYMMGHTQMMIKNRSATKLDDLNKKHNDQLNDAMGTN